MTTAEETLMNPIRLLQVGQAGFPAGREFRDKHFARVYKDYYRKIFAICNRYSPRSEDAKDMVHDVFMLYFQNYDRFRHEANPSTWMFRVAINLGIQKWRREKIRLRWSQEMMTDADDTSDQETSLLNRIALDKVLNGYPERTRKVFCLHHVERLTQMEICRKLGVSRATVTRHLVQTRRGDKSLPR